MSLVKQLITLIFGVISLTSALVAFFLLLQMFFLYPSAHPVLATTGQVEIQSKLTPSTVTIPGKAEALPLIPVTLQLGEWVLPTQGISILQFPNSQQPRGYILYGHNWPSLFGSLSRIQLGETITLSFPDSSTKSYSVQSSFVVSPDRIDVLELASDPQMLLLYTCTGMFDHNRLVVLAKSDII